LLVTTQAVSLILRSLDKIKELLAYLEQHESEPEGEDKALIAELNAMAAGQSSEPAKVEAAAEPLPSSPVPDEHGFVPVPAAETGNLVPASQAQEKPAVAPAQTPKIETAAAGDDHGAKEKKGGSVADQTIRVGVDQLEKLMTTVSELVLTRNQLLQILRGQKESAFVAPLQRLNQVTSELQEGVMKTRMQPIGNAWSKLPRIIRDLSNELSKKIDLQMVGAETELDRQVLELIKDPLTHMVRNSADHGIEVPADRIKAGKPETGVIMLNAYHEGGHIIIQITDDGRGLALDKIKAKILEKKLATESELSGMSDQQIMQYIFKPGFSTATKVTAVSGRGVGMDVVKTNIEKIGGTIDFQSTQGKGSAFFIKIPLTLAIVSALLVECNGEHFAIPQISVVELVQASADSEHRVERINETSVLRLRNHLLPLVSLRKTLKVGDDEIKPDGRHFVIVIQAGNSTFGIIVDRVFDTEEIVVKPVSSLLRNLNIYSGNTILGDGSVVMILDPNGIVAHADALHGENASARQAQQASQVKRDADRQSLLLFQVGDESPKAVPLSLVARLEQVDRKAIEYSNGSPMIQYCGKLMPLVPVGVNVVMSKEGMQTIVVFADQDKNMGLLVDRIIDIVEDTLHVDLTSRRPGLLGTSIISGKATDIIDAAFYLAQAFQDWFNVESDGEFGGDKSRRVLLVDDSPFFRNLLTPLLKVAGYNVTTVNNASDALKLEEMDEKFDVIVSDIEMPGMNGFEFASAVRHGRHWSRIPMVALSSHATPRDLDRGREAGFTEYVPKFNRDALLATLQKTLVHTEGRA